MRRLLVTLALVVLTAAVFTAPASAAPYCSPGQEPEFLFGFAHLKSLLGDKMGEPVECEHANPENGDTLQQTTTGLAFYRNSTNTPTFTNGIEHWGWTSLGLVYWTGDSADPPGVDPTTPVPTRIPDPTPIPVSESELPVHGGAIWSVSFSSDGRLLASGSRDRNAGIWDAQTGVRLHVLQGHTGNVMSVAFSEDGSVLATAGEDGGLEPRGTHTIALWDPDSGKKIGTLDGHFADVYSIAFSPDGNLLASGGWDRTLRLWDVSSRQLVQKLEGHSNLIGEVAFSPDGSMVAARHGGTVTLWNVAAGSKVGEISGLTSGWLNDFAFHPGGNLIAVGLDEGLVLWDLSTSKVQAPLQGYSGRPGNISFSPDGNLIAIASNDYLVTLWDLSSRGHLHTIRAAEQGPNISFSPTIAFAPDGGTLAIGDRAGGISVWNVATGGRIRTFGPSEAIPAATPTTVPVTTFVPTESPTPTLVPVATVDPTPTPARLSPLRDDYSTAALSLFRDAAFSDSRGQFPLRRWVSPMVISIGGSPTSDDITTVHANLQDIAAVTGHPIRVAAEGEASNVQIMFVPKRDFGLWMPQATVAADSIGMSQTWSTNFRITKSTIVVDIARSGWERNNLVIHEIAHSFGMRHADGDSNSVFFPIVRDKYERFRPLDLEAMKLLYDTRLYPGMTLGEYDAMIAG